MLDLIFFVFQVVYNFKFVSTEVYIIQQIKFGETRTNSQSVKPENLKFGSPFNLTLIELVGNLQGEKKKEKERNRKKKSGLRRLIQI